MSAVRRHHGLSAVNAWRSGYIRTRAHHGIAGFAEFNFFERNGAAPIINGGSVTLKPDDQRDKLVATSLTEGHRLASDYFLDGLVSPRWVEEQRIKVKKEEKCLHLHGCRQPKEQPENRKREHYARERQKQ